VAWVNGAKADMPVTSALNPIKVSKIDINKAISLRARWRWGIGVPP